MKLILNPEYKVKAGEPDCDHEKTTVKLGNTIYEFCDECMVVWVRKEE